MTPHQPPHTASRSALALALAALCACGACAPRAPMRSCHAGEDLPIPLEVAVSDNLSAPHEDLTDWKIIHLPSAGQLQVDVWLESQAPPGALAQLRDPRGALVAQRPLSTSPYHALGPVTAEAGTWYLQITTPSGSFDYVVVAHHAQAPGLTMSRPE